MLDLPLPESDRLRILQVLTHHYDAYVNLVNVFMRTSGGQRRIEIELSFSPDTPASRIETVHSLIHDELEQHLGALEFQLIARCYSK